MPRKVIAYACIFKCARNVTTQKAGMERHEKCCKANPANRTCNTCRHELKKYYGVYGFSCKIDANDTGKMLKYNCEKWVMYGDE